MLTKLVLYYDLLAQPGFVNFITAHGVVWIDDTPAIIVRRGTVTLNTIAYYYFLPDTELVADAGLREGFELRRLFNIVALEMIRRDDRFGISDENLNVGSCDNLSIRFTRQQVDCVVSRDCRVKVIKGCIVEELVIPGVLGNVIACEQSYI